MFQAWWGRGTAPLCTTDAALRVLLSEGGTRDLRWGGLCAVRIICILISQQQSVLQSLSNSTWHIILKDTAGTREAKLHLNVGKLLSLG